MTNKINGFSAGKSNKLNNQCIDKRKPLLCKSIEMDIKLNSNNEIKNSNDITSRQQEADPNFRSIREVDNSIIFITSLWPLIEE